MLCYSKSLQSCPTLCDPIDSSPPGSPCPWDSPGKNTGVGCHFLLQCMKVKSESEDAHLCPTLSDPMDCSLPGSSIHGIFQARVLEWDAIAFSDLYVYCPIITYVYICLSSKLGLLVEELKVIFFFFVSLIQNPMMTELNGWIKEKFVVWMATLINEWRKGWWIVAIIVQLFQRRACLTLILKACGGNNAGPSFSKGVRPWCLEA